MFYIVLSLVAFIASVIAHIFFCRKNPGTGLHAKIFILISVIFLCVYAAAVYAVGKAGVFNPHYFWGLPLKATAGIIFILLIPVYLVFYTLTQLMSPSKKILLTVAARGDLTYGDIVRCVEEEDFIGTRLSDLCASGCAVLVDGRYRLTPHGQKIALMLNIMQLVLGREMGG